MYTSYPPRFMKGGAMFHVKHYALNVKLPLRFRPGAGALANRLRGDLRIVEEGDQRDTTNDIANQRRREESTQVLRPCDGANTDAIERIYGSGDDMGKTAKRDEIRQDNDDLEFGGVRCR